METVCKECNDYLGSKVDFNLVKDCFIQTKIYIPKTG